MAIRQDYEFKNIDNLTTHVILRRSDLKYSVGIGGSMIPTYTNSQCFLHLPRMQTGAVTLFNL